MSPTNDACLVCGETRAKHRFLWTFPTDEWCPLALLDDDKWTAAQLCVSRAHEKAIAAATKANKIETTFFEDFPAKSPPPELLRNPLWTIWLPFAPAIGQPVTIPGSGTLIPSRVALVFAENRDTWVLEVSGAFINGEVPA